MSFSVAVSIKNRGEETENTLLVLLHLSGLRLLVLYFHKLINRPLRRGKKCNLRGNENIMKLKKKKFNYKLCHPKILTVKP